MGFSLKSDDAGTERQVYDRMKDKVTDEVKRFFRPEFLNRLDATIVFHQLARDEILLIVDLMMAMVKKELEEKGLIRVSRQGGRNQCTLYAITWQPIDDCSGKLDINATTTAPHDWKRWTPPDGGST